MSRDERSPADIPTLTDVVCPGDALAPRGLWLPLQRTPQPPLAHCAPPRTDWAVRLPPPLRPRADALFDEVLTRVRARLGRR